MARDYQPTIHPSSVIEPGAVIGPDCRIGPFCHIGPNVRLEQGVVLHSHVVIAGHTRIGAETQIWPFASIGHQPQDLKFSGEITTLEIGARCMIRESVSMNPGTQGGGGVTIIGDDCLFMLGSHVGHDCKVGDRVILANNAALAGHVELGDDVVIGGLSGVHQFCRIGRGAMIGAVVMVTADVVPFATVMTDRPDVAGLNLVGLRRRGMNKAEINGLRAAFDDLFSGPGNLRERIEPLAQVYADNRLVAEMLDFLRADSKRSFLTPRQKS